MINNPKMNYLKNILTILIFIFLFNSCDAVFKDCTSVFKIVELSVVTTEGEPVELDEVNIINKTTGNALDLCSDGYDCDENRPSGAPELGRYTIFHDGLRDQVGKGGLIIQINGSNEVTSFQEEFLISDDGCHVSKEAGPDTVFVELNN